ncbi:MAG TPA: oligosaccharide flippase family protein [Rhizomicrobium sp.]
MTADDASSRNDLSRLSVGGRLKFLFRDSVLYGGANALNRAFGLITFPIVVRHFSTAEYGTFDLFTTFTTLLTFAIIFGQDSAVARYFYEYPETEARRQVISQSLLFQLFLIALLIPTLWLLAPFLSRQLLASTANAPTLLRLILLQVPFLLLSSFAQNILKWTFARTRYLILSVGTTVFSALLLVVGVTVLDIDVAGALKMLLLSQIVFGGLGLAFVWSWLRPPQDWTILRRLVVYAAPLGVIAIASICVPALERTFILAFMGPTPLGFYVAGGKVALVAMLPMQAFQIAWGPFYLSIFREPDAAATYNWILKVFALTMCTVVMLLTAVAEPLTVLLASHRYSGASIVGFAVAMGYAVQAIGWITGIGITLSKNSHLSLYSYLTSLIVTVAAIYILIQTVGLVGVAWGVLIGQIAKMTVEAWLGQRAYRLDWHYAGVVTLTAVTLLLGLASQLVYAAMGPWYGAATAALGVPLVLVTGFATTFNTYDRRRLMQWLPLLRSRAA